MKSIINKASWLWETVLEGILIIPGVFFAVLGISVWKERYMLRPVYFPIIGSVLSFRQNNAVDPKADQSYMPNLLLIVVSDVCYLSFWVLFSITINGSNSILELGTLRLHLLLFQVLKCGRYLTSYV